METVDKFGNTVHEGQRVVHTGDGGFTPPDAVVTGINGDGTMQLDDLTSEDETYKSCCNVSPDDIEA